MRLSTEGKLRLAVKLAFVTGLGASATGAYAQDTGSSDGVKLDSVQVTGSRIKQPNLTSTSSMTILTDDELKYQGTVNIETLLNSLPQAFAEFGTGDSNGASGTATVNLRGLGSNRTLVLIDGKRLMGGDPGLDNSPDLNFIPPALVEKVEVLSGGASAVYGSDAVAGVVNFKMKRDFEGMELDSQGTGTSKGDAWTRDATFIWGSNYADGKGNVTLYAGVNKESALTEDKRDVSKCSYSTTISTGSTTGNTHTCSGSGFTSQGTLYSYDRAAAGLSYYSYPNADGSRSLTDHSPPKFNFAPYNYFQRPTDRYDIGGFAHDELNSHVDLYADAMYMDSHTVAQIAPTLFAEQGTVPCNSPLLSASEVDYLCTQAGLTSSQSATFLPLKRLVELGPRESDLRHQQNRIVLGVKGEIVDNWNYDLSLQRGQVIVDAGALNYVDTSKVSNAVNTIVDSNGDAQCASSAAVAAGCVPLDLFQKGAITPAQLAYIKANGYSQSSLVQQIATADVSGDLGQYGLISPFATDGVGVSVGYEYRKEQLAFNPDAITEAGGLGGGGGASPPVSGQYQVNDVFGEIQLPILENIPFAKTLLVDGAYRHSDYSTAGNTDSYKGGAQWAPVSDIAFRYSFQKAIRAPGITELFSPITVGLFGGNDPCGKAELALAGAPSEQECANTGVTAAQYAAGGVRDCQAGQCNVQTGGNEALKPEESNTHSVGFVFTPSFVKNLSVTVDYFDISVENAITSLDPNITLKECLTTGDSTCALIHRDPVNGTIWTSPTDYVAGNDINAESLKTTGVDIQGDYKLPLSTVGLADAGSLMFDYVATYLDTYESEQSPASGNIDCAGYYGVLCGTPNPKYRHKFRITWGSTFGLNLSAAWRYFGSAKLDGDSTNPNLQQFGGVIDSIDAKLKAVNYLDLSGNYLLPIPGENITIRFGVNNVTNVKPQAVSSGGTFAISAPPFGNGNTYPNVYDVLGPNFFLGLTANF